MYCLSKRMSYLIHNLPTHQIIKYSLMVYMIFIYSYAFADSGADILQGTDKSFWATFEGTGRNYIYAGEGVLALATYIKTKNILTLAGIVIVSVFINVVLKMANQS